MSARPCTCVLIALLLAEPAHWASADGCFFTDNYEQDVYAPDQKVVIAWDGRQEMMILATKARSDALANFGWIIPIQSTTKPTVELADVEVFRDLSDYFKSIGRLLGAQMMGINGTAPDTIEVIESKELGLYDITVLKASDPEDLRDWLNTDAFHLPAEAPSVLARYTNDAFYFLAARLDLMNKHQDDIERLKKHDLWDTVKDVAASVPTTDYRARSMFYFVDDRLERLYHSFGHYAIALAADVAFHVIRGEPYPSRLEGYFPRAEYDRLLQAGPRIALPERISDPFGLMGERDKPNTPSPQVVLPDGEAVKDSVFKLCETLVRLRLGMARPLKISFTPAEPVFPLHISRINTSDVTVTAYVFAAQPLKDESNTLATSAYKELTCGFREKMRVHLDISPCRFVTKLTFKGPSSRFDEDACFVAMNDEERRRYTDRTENFYRAIEEGDIDYVRNHITDLPDINTHYSGERPLYFAVREEQRDIVAFLLSQGATVDTSGNMFFADTLSGAIYLDNPAILELLLNHSRLDVSFRFKPEGWSSPGGETLLHRAAESGAIATVDWLLTQGANADITGPYGETPLFAMISGGSSSAWQMHRTKTIVDLLLAHGADINARNDKGETVLHEAYSKSPESVAFLLERGADPSIADAHGETPLFVTISRGYWQMDRTKAVIDLLLAHGANINARNDKGETVLHKVHYESPELVAFLLDRGADPNIADKGGRTRLYHQIEALKRDKDLKTPRLRRLLLEKDADPNSPTTRGATPLHLAARQGNMEAAKLLLAYGAKGDIADQWGKTALDYAQERGDEAIIELLQAAATPSEAPVPNSER